MDFTPELVNLIIRFGFNLFIAFVVIKLIYYRDFTSIEFVFTYFMFNTLIFFFAYLLSNITLNIGFAFGMFAVFAILRYRTDPIPIKEMTYLFIVITIGVLNALSKTDVSFTILLFSNASIVLLTLTLEKSWQSHYLIRRNIIYEKIDNIKPENHDKLLADLKERTGLDIIKFELKKTNFLRDTVNIRVYYKE